MPYENRLLAHQWTKKKDDEVEGIWWVLAVLTKKKRWYYLKWKKLREEISHKIRLYFY